jgi:hypothetical protein
VPTDRTWADERASGQSVNAATSTMRATDPCEMRYGAVTGRLASRVQVRSTMVTKPRARPPTLALAVALAGCAVGCGSAAAPDTSATDESEAEASEVQSSHFAYVGVEGVDSQDAQAAAASAAQPSALSCVTRAPDPNVPLAVDVTLSGCTGPFGLATLSGHVVVTFSQNADGTLHAHHEGMGLTVGVLAVAFHADADITVSGSTRNVRWTGEWQRYNEAGEMVDHHSDVTIVVDTASHCRDTSGSAVTRVGSREVDSTMDGYRVCVAADGLEQCPLGTVVHVHEDTGRTVRVTFDGTDVATEQGASWSKAVLLTCGG